MSLQTRLFGYAADVTILIAIRTLKTAQLRLERVTVRGDWWIRDQRLVTCTQQVSWIVVFTEERTPTIIPMRVADHEIETKPSSKYTGIIIDSKMSFVVHILRTADKGVSPFGRLMVHVPSVVDCS